MNEDRPTHYDGSLLNTEVFNDDTLQEPFLLTDEVRANIAGNPYDKS
ncbi:hypothetical protein IHV10_11215 [Fictibacillus sp. 5RED26]|nr:MULTISPECIES: hypothetical protein [unclassified Fictibacillus]MBH0156938.1 hypothetical protein [Fictibacillus sp. 5RED26]MBH0163950.1 hypothetical protein [Fictibacillus sp. 7GRE50]MBH0173927.1 hypothetical protein [Fictibacillus sp. 23RED33]